MTLHEKKRLGKFGEMFRAFRNARATKPLDSPARKARTIRPHVVLPAATYNPPPSENPAAAKNRPAADAVDVDPKATGARGTAASRDVAGGRDATDARRSVQPRETPAGPRRPATRKVASDPAAAAHSNGPLEAESESLYLHAKRQLLAEHCRRQLVQKSSGAYPSSGLIRPDNNKSARATTPSQFPKKDGNARDLSRRMTQTLELLLSGDSEKQIAVKLHLSPHTVHVYVKALYKHYDVSSRGELLARWVKR